MNQYQIGNKIYEIIIEGVKNTKHSNSDVFEILRECMCFASYLRFIDDNNMQYLYEIKIRLEKIEEMCNHRTYLILNINELFKLINDYYYLIIKEKEGIDTDCIVEANKLKKENECLKKENEKLKKLLDKLLQED